MSGHRTQTDVLNRDFLETRAKILELAASLDRLDRARSSSSQDPDPRRITLQKGLEALRSSEPGRAEAVQRIFSHEYDPEWQKRLELTPQRSGRS